MDYKKQIIEMLEKIDNICWLRSIYVFVKTLIGQGIDMENNMNSTVKNTEQASLSKEQELEQYKDWINELMQKVTDPERLKRTYKFLVYLYLREQNHESTGH